MSITKLSILKNTFGYSQFRLNQEEVIDTVLAKNDCLVIMPTGGGKSMCYQLPALMMDGLTIVVSPLIALMQDQVTALQQMNVPSAALHNNIDREEAKNIHNGLIKGEIKLLYISPERLNTPNVIDFLKSLTISQFAVDEAHCVSVWGNDFRPEYAALKLIKREFDVPIIALTATADQATQDDIIDKLHIPDAKRFLSSFERANINIRVKSGLNRKAQIIRFLSNHNDQTGIVYCLSRKSCEKMSNDLSNSGFKSGYYHAGMSADKRNKVQKDFQNDKLQIICATIAFGMGIDKSNVRWVIHFNIPKNVESYYQEIGRSGRDGMKAEALMFYSWADMALYKKFITDGNASSQFKFVQEAKLQRIWEYANTSDCRTNFILNYFGEFRSEGCGHCDNCLYPPQKIDGKVTVQKALSAVIRAKESLSVNLLIDLLRGSNRKEIFDKRLDQIKTYGAGREYSYIEWKEYIIQIIDKGLLRMDYTDGMKLKLTPLSKEALQGSKSIELKKVDTGSINASGTKVKKEKPKKITATELLNTELKQIIMDWRKVIAEERDIAAYKVIDDKTVEELIKHKPLFPTDIRNIEGIGAQRYDRIGESLMRTLQEYMIEQTHKKVYKGQSIISTLRLLESGKSIDEIVKIRKNHKATVITHLCDLYKKGIDTKLMEHIEKEEFQDIKSAYIESNYADKLMDIQKHLNKTYPFYKIMIVQTIIGTK